jgi:hypothetical protein
MARKKTIVVQEDIRSVSISTYEKNRNKLMPCSNIEPTYMIDMLTQAIVVLAEQCNVEERAEMNIDVLCNMMQQSYKEYKNNQKN